MGRISALYAKHLISGLDLLKFRGSLHNALLALEETLSVCKFHLQSEVIDKPTDNTRVYFTILSLNPSTRTNN